MISADYFLPVLLTSEQFTSLSTGLQQNFKVASSRFAKFKEFYAKLELILIVRSRDKNACNSYCWGAERIKLAQNFTNIDDKGNRVANPGLRLNTSASLKGFSAR